MSLKKQKLHILSILFDNLQETPSRLVQSTTIADRMNVGLPELRQILKCMEGMGVIETDPDLQYSLITREGLHWLAQQSPQGHRCNGDRQGNRVNIS